ncbi:hypothetical protein Tco_0482533, partial [Tanacetum coccineum]
NELISNRMSVEEIREFIGCDIDAIDGGWLQGSEDQNGDDVDLKAEEQDDIVTV